MLDKSKTYLIVGLGLLGGKYAQVLSQKGYNVTGITHSQSTLDYALQHGYIRAGKNADFQDLVREADCIIFGLYPTVLLDWVKQYGQLIRPGTLLTDVSGVKRGVVEPVQQALPAGVEFIASHPMAGRETSGIAHSAEVNFAPANFIITPTEKNTPQGIEWCRALAETLGFCRISVLSPAEHDHMIGYVSQLCHAIAVSLMCASDNTELARYTGDSFRGGHEAHESDVRASALLQHRQCVAGTSSCGEHRVCHDHEALVYVLGKLAVINHRDVGLLVTVKSYVSDFRHGNECLESVHHAYAGAENRDNGELAAGNLLGRHPADRGLYLNVVKWKIAGDLISHQKGNLFKQFAEILGTGFLLPHDSQLVLDKRMVNYV